MSWRRTSYMEQRGVAKGRPGKTHHLTEVVQQRFHYVYGPYAEPVLHVKPGDIVVTETMDAFEGKLKTEADSPSALLNVPFAESAMRAHRCGGSREGRCPCSAR